MSAPDEVVIVATDEASAEALGFSAIQTAWPGDGPSRFDAGHCAALRAQPPGEAWNPTFVVESK